jgi:sigma-B regulation protein RsbU (phosphoserine phosphatase)
MDTAQAMKTTASVVGEIVRDGLLKRLETLRKVSLENGRAADLERFLCEVDSAIARFEKGTFGVCEECHETIGVQTLLADPLARVCLDELTGKQRTDLEDDLQFAAEIQRGLLPDRDIRHGRWSLDFHYEPVRIVSGDYCDVIVEGDELYFVLGDVSGKGIAASMLMSNLHAIFHSLVPLGLDLVELVSRANRLLLRSSLSNQFATLVCGRANADGTIETVNAGHPSPLVIKNGVKGELDVAGLPLGMFVDAEFASTSVRLDSGDALLLFTDGLTEAFDVTETEFGSARLSASLDGLSFDGPTDLIRHCIDQVNRFRGGAEQHDDLSLLALSYV